MPIVVIDDPTRYFSHPKKTRLQAATGTSQSEIAARILNGLKVFFIDSEHNIDFDKDFHISLLYMVDKVSK